MINKKIKIASLFSGIGGFESGIYQALGRENVEIVFSSEIDKYASKGYEIMYGHKPHGDITKIESQDIPDFDLLVGGSPCQSFSIAGKRLGLTDSRGTLFYEYARIVNDKRPKAFIYENVKGLVNHDKGNTFKGMCEIFEGIGYKITHQIVNSKHHGVAQNRERIFIIGYLDHSKDYEFPKNQPLNLAIKDILEECVDERFYLSEEQVAKFKPKTKKSDIKQVGYIDNKYKDKGTFNVWDEKGISPTLLSVDYKMPKLIMENKIQKAGHLEGYEHEASNRIYDTDGISPTIATSKEPKIIVEGNIGNYQSTGRVFSKEGISPTIDTMQGGNRQPKIIIEGQVGEYQDQLVMNPEGISKCILSGNPKKYISEPYNTTKDGVSYAITTRTSACYLPQHVEKSKATLIQETNNQEKKHFRIRRLTPLECLRLQGFSDDYYYNLKEQGISNSQIYKMAGNAVTTKVIKALVEQLDLS